MNAAARALPPLPVDRPQGRTHNAFNEHRPLTLRDGAQLAAAAQDAPAKSWKPWYDSIIDFLILQPRASLAEIAAAVGRTPTWVRMIVRSDSFQTRLAARRDEHNRVVSQAVTERMGAVALTGLDILLEQMQTKRTNIPIDVVSRTVDSMLSKMGYGAQSAPAPTAVNVQMNFGVSPNVLREARETLRQVEASRLEGNRAEGTGGNDTLQPMTTNQRAAISGGVAAVEGGAVERDAVDDGPVAAPAPPLSSAEGGADKRVVLNPETGEG